MWSQGVSGTPKLSEDVDQFPEIRAFSQKFHFKTKLIGYKVFNQSVQYEYNLRMMLFCEHSAFFWVVLPVNSFRCTQHCDIMAWGRLIRGDNQSRIILAPHDIKGIESLSLIMHISRPKGRGW